VAKNDETLTIDIDSDGIATVTIDVPGKPMNVWDDALMEEFPKFVDELNSNDDIKGAVLVSGKKSGFLAGADLNMLGSSEAQTMKEAFEMAWGLNANLRRMETGGHTAKDLLKGKAHAKPVACALHGLALGGGLELALACHYRVCSDNPKIQLGLPEVQVGLLPGGGGTQRLPRLAGLQAAGMAIMMGQPMNPQAALAQNVINEVAPHDEVVDKAKAWVKANPKAAAPWDKKGYKFPGGAGSMDPRAVPLYMGSSALALKQSKGNYEAVKAILSCLYEGSMLPMDTALRVESKYFTRLLSGPQAKNMIRTLFVNKQAADKGAGRPEGVPPTELKTVGVLGAGLMGSGITHVTAKGGMNVIVLDRNMEEAQKAVDYSQKIMDKRKARGKTTQEKVDAFMARIKPTDNYDALKDVDLIIEAVFERPDVKADVIKKTVRMLSLHPILQRCQSLALQKTANVPINLSACTSSLPLKKCHCWKSSLVKRAATRRWPLRSIITRKSARRRSWSKMYAASSPTGFSHPMPMKRR